MKDSFAHGLSSICNLVDIEFTPRNTAGKFFRGAFVMTKRVVCFMSVMLAIPIFAMADRSKVDIIGTVQDVRVFNFPSQPADYVQIDAYDSSFSHLANLRMACSDIAYCANIANLMGCSWVASVADDPTTPGRNITTYNCIPPEIGGMCMRFSGTLVWDDRWRSSMPLVQVTPATGCDPVPLIR
jgi:hypothetical protein